MSPARAQTLIESKAITMTLMHLPLGTSNTPNSFVDLSNFSNNFCFASLEVWEINWRYFHCGYLRKPKTNWFPRDNKFSISQKHFTLNSCGSKDIPGSPDEDNSFLEIYGSSWIYNFVLQHCFHQCAGVAVACEHLSPPKWREDKWQLEICLCSQATAVGLQGKGCDLLWTITIPTWLFLW